MPPPGHEPLLNAIRAQPDDDVLRLAYADWLEENDDPERAAFVRVQCRLAALGHGPLWPTPGTHPPLALGGLTAEAAALTPAGRWSCGRRTARSGSPNCRSCRGARSCSTGGSPRRSGPR